MLPWPLTSISVSAICLRLTGTPLPMFSASPALLEYFSRTQGLLRERIGQCCPGELALRCLDARQVAERSDE